MILYQQKPHRQKTTVMMEEYVDYASTKQLPTLIAISLILGLGKGGVPGVATMATASTVLTAPTHIDNGLGYAVALMVPILTMIDIFAAYLHRSVLDWTTIWLLLPLSSVGMILGQYISDRYLTDKGARILVGVILLSILALRTWKDVLAYISPMWAIEHHISGDDKERISDDDEEEDDEDDDNIAVVQMPLVDRDETKQRMVAMESGESNHKNEGDDVAASSSSATLTATNSRQRNRRRRKVPIGKSKRLVWACSVGLIGGMATMLTNSMGPILNVYLLSVAELSPQAYVGTRAMFFCFLNLGKLPIRIVGGTLGLPMLPLAVGLGVVSAAGVFLAKPIMLSINERLFVKLELTVVLFAGLRLMFMDIRG